MHGCRITWSLFIVTMRPGLTPWDFSDLSARSLSRQAEIAESLGYESFWLPESHFIAGAIPDPLMLLASVAATTRTLRLGTTSFLVPLRNPLQAAEQVAVLDRLSNGRVTLGIGRGYASAMLRAFDVAPREKRARFEQNLQAMLRAWKGEAVRPGNGGEAVVLDPLPVQQPHPPVWVAAFGPKALAQAGRLGMPYLASPMEPVERLRANYERHAVACGEAGVVVPPEVPVMRTVFVSDDADLVARVREQLEIGAREVASSGLRRGLSLAPDDWAIVGGRSEVKDRVAAYVEELGVTHLVVTRLRIGRVEPEALERSVRLAAEVLG